MDQPDQILHRAFEYPDERPSGHFTFDPLTGAVEPLHRLASPDAALHLGPIHVLGEAAATEAARDAAQAPVQVARWHVMFLARGKRGPFHVVTEVARAAADRAAVRRTLHDDGNESRPITAGSAAFRVVGAGAR